MTLTKTASSAALQPGKGLSTGGRFEDWGEIEAILAASLPLPDCIGRATPRARRRRHELLAGLIVCFCVAALPLDEAERRCSGAGCGVEVPSEPAAASPRPARVARTDVDRDGTSLTEGRSAVADPGHVGDVLVAPVQAAPVQAAPMPSQASLSPVQDPVADQAPVGVEPERARHRHHHHAWMRRRYHAWR